MYPAIEQPDFQSRDRLSQRGRRTGARSLVPRLAIRLALVFALVGPASMIRAGDDRADEGDGVPRAGEIAPLQHLLERIDRDFGGRVLKVEIDDEGHEHGRTWVYKAKVLTSDGHVLELEYDAKDLELLKVDD